MCYFVNYRSDYTFGENWSPCTRTLFFFLCIFVHHTEKAPDTARFLIWSLSPYILTMTAYPDQYNSDLSTQTVVRERAKQEGREQCTLLLYLTQQDSFWLQSNKNMIFYFLLSIPLAAQWFDTKRNKWWWQSTLLLSFLIDFCFFWVRRLTLVWCFWSHLWRRKPKKKFVM